MKTFALASLAAIALLAQDPPAQQRPTFKSGIDVVPVDVSVVDRTGRPIADLESSDFTLVVDGKPRRIASAQFISVARNVDEAPPVPLNYSTNVTSAGGRLIAVVVDQGNISAGTGKLAVDAAKRFVGGLNPADRVALYTIPGAGPRIDFTSNHAMVQRLLDRVVGTAVQNVGPHNLGVSEVMALDRNDERTIANVIDRECPAFSNTAELSACRAQLAGEARALMGEIVERTRTSILALRDLFQRLALVPSPKTVVLISEGLFLERDLSQVNWVASLAARGQLSLYVLQLEPAQFDASNPRVSATRMADIDLAQQGLGYLTGMARGDVFRVTSGADFAFSRISLELSGYYLLSFEPEAGDRDGKSHKIKVGVPGRRDISVRARTEFAFDGARQKTNEEVLGETLRSPLLATDIGLKIATYTFLDPDTGKLRVVIASELDRTTNPTGNVSVAYAMLDTKGAIAASDFEPQLKAPLSAAKTQTYIGAAVVPPGIYTLKLGVRDDQGKRGSVEHSFRAELASAGQVKIGGLLLAERAENVGPLRPAVSANFSSDFLQTYLELSSDAPEQLKNASVVVEVARGETDRALDSAVAVFDDNPDSARVRVAQASVTIALLPPGDYVARAVISVFGRKAGQVVRPFTIVEK
jgi:VWFA-related protein